MAADECSLMCDSNQLRSVVSLLLLLIFLMGWMCLVTRLCLTLWDPMDYIPPGSSVHGDSPGKNTGVGGHALLQGIFQTQRLNPGLLHCRYILYHLSHWGNPFPMAEPVQFLVKCDLIHFILHFKLSIGLWCHSDTTLSAFHSIWTLATLISPKLLLLPWKLLPEMSMWPCPSFSPSVIQILPIPFSCLMFLYSISHHLINLFSFFFVFSSFY